MPAKKRATKKSKDMTALEIGAGVAAAAVAAGVAGYYFYGSKDAKKHRRATARWARDLQRDVMKGAKKLKNINADTIARIVDEAAAAYQGVHGVDPTEVRRAAKELKDNWDHIQKDLNGTTKKVAKAAKKVTKKTKKTAQKRK